MSDSAHFHNILQNIKSRISKLSSIDNVELGDFAITHYWAPPDWESGKFRNMIRRYQNRNGVRDIIDGRMPFIHHNDIDPEFYPIECRFIRRATGWQLLCFIEHHANDERWIPLLLRRADKLYKKFGRFMVPISDMEAMMVISELV